MKSESGFSFAMASQPFEFDVWALHSKSGVSQKTLPYKYYSLPTIVKLKTIYNIFWFDPDFMHFWARLGSNFFALVFSYV